MTPDVRDLYQQLIVDHSKSPRNCRVIEGADCSAEGYNPLCGDHVTLFVKLEGDRVKDISFQGNGCAISTASASLLTEGHARCASPSASRRPTRGTAEPGVLER